jgi:hypothetical protein
VMQAVGQTEVRAVQLFLVQHLAIVGIDCRAQAEQFLGHGRCFGGSLCVPVTDGYHVKAGQSMLLELAHRLQVRLGNDAGPDQAHAKRITRHPDPPCTATSHGMSGRGGHRTAPLGHAAQAAPMQHRSPDTRQNTAIGTTLSTRRKTRMPVGVRRTSGRSGTTALRPAPGGDGVDGGEG